MKILGWLILIIGSIYNMLIVISEGDSVYADGYGDYLWDLLLIDLGLTALKYIVLGVLLINIGSYVKKKKFSVFLSTIFWIIIFTALYTYKTFFYMTPDEKFNSDFFEYSLESLADIEYIQKQPVQALQGYWGMYDIYGDVTGSAIHIDEEYIHVLNTDTIMEFESGLATSSYDVSFADDGLGELLIYDGPNYSKSYIKFINEDSIGVVIDANDGVLAHMSENFGLNIEESVLKLVRISEETFNKILDNAYDMAK